MKKILFATLVASDVLAMGADKVFKVSGCSNPTEQQVQGLYDDFDKARDERKKCYELAMEEYNKDSYSAQFTEANYNNEAALSKLDDYFHNELREVSRFPSPKEENDLKNIRRYFDLKYVNIRIVDANSYINGLYLSRERKNSFIKALTSDEELSKLVDKFCDEFKFMDMTSDLYKELCADKVDLSMDLKLNSMLESDVRSHMLNDSKKSKVYRELIVSYLARTNAFNFVSDYYISPNRLKNRLVANWKEAALIGASGTICYSYENFYGASLFKHFSSLPQDEIYYPWYCPMKPSNVFFHEVGHALDFFSQTMTRSDHTLETVYPKLVDIRVNHAAFDEQREKILKAFSEDPESLSFTKESLRTEETDLNSITDLLRENLTRPIFQSNFLITSSAEAWQIFGIFLESHKKPYIYSTGEKTFSYSDTLYINKMSDFALNCDMELPLRCHHLGMSDNDYIALKKNPKAEKSPLRSIIEYHVPLNTYGALMQIYGTSMQAYVFKLMYPKGLTQQLQTEYRLNSSLREFKQVQTAPEGER